MIRPADFLRIAMVAAVVTTAIQGQERPVFQSRAAAVAVDVSVADGRRVVAGLTAADFELRDNGVVQTIETTSLEAIPFDLTLVVDTSGSLDRQTTDQFRADVAVIAKMLNPQDRFRLVTFATTGTDAFGWLPGAVAPPLGKIAAGGATAFYATLGAVLARRTSPGRRHLVVAMSDGFDTVSALDEGDLQHLAGVGDAVLHIILRRQSLAPEGNWGWVPRVGPGDTGALRRAAESTGGRLREVNPEASLLEEFRAALAEFRTSYLLWYTPQGVAPTGWHTIDVRLKAGRYELRARRGYDAGGGRP
jgi:hypothetical protein